MRKISGFSLIELLIGMAIALVALIAISDIYLNTRQTNRIQLMQSRISEDGRFAMSVIQRSISQAGYRVNSATVMPSDRISGNATQLSLRFESDGTNQMDCNVASAANGAHTMVISLNANSLQCALDGGAAVAWLAGANTGSGSSSDVISLQFQYGIDTGPSTSADFGCGTDIGSGNVAGDCVSDLYATTIPDVASGYLAAQVMSARVCIVLRSEQTDSSIVKAAPVTDCQGNNITGSQNDNRLYRKFNTTVLLRNR